MLNVKWPVCCFGLLVFLLCLVLALACARVCFVGPLSGLSPCSWSWAPRGQRPENRSFLHFSTRKTQFCTGIPLLWRCPSSLLTRMCSCLLLILPSLFPVAKAGVLYGPVTDENAGALPSPSSVTGLCIDGVVGIAVVQCAQVPFQLISLSEILALQS